MANEILILIFFISSIAHANGDKFIYESPNQRDKKIYFYVDEIRISDLLDCRKKICAAYKVAVGESKIPSRVEWTPGGVNPTSILCERMGANPRIGYLENGNELSLCYFKDGSFIFGWDLIQIFKRTSGN